MIRGFMLAALVAAAIAARAGAEQHPAHPPPEQLGTVSFPVSCAPAAAVAFERGVALLHSFAYDAARQVFADVAAADPRCAMAHWGIAMSLYHPLWSPPDPADLQTGRAELVLAREVGAPTERERLLIGALTAYYRADAGPSPAARARDYAAAMALAARSQPHDTEVQILYALALVATAPADDASHANQKQAGAILEPIYRANPDHPGVAHYLIHTYDSAELAPRGLAAARAYAKIAPSVPHALHMPSHIFTRLGLWDDSIASNLAARTAAHAQGDVGEELHAMDYLAYAYLQRDRQAEAEQVVAALKSMPALAGQDFKVGYAATAMPVRLAMERQRWNDALALQPLAGAAPHVAAVVFWARAVAQARLGHPAAADEDIERLAAGARQLEAAGNLYWKSQVEVLGLEARAWQADARQQPLEAVQLLTQAADAEDRVEKLPVTPGPVVPAREQLGDLLLMRNRPREALAAYQRSLSQAPGRRGSLTGATRAARLLGDTRALEQLGAGPP